MFEWGRRGRNKTALDRMNVYLICATTCGCATTQAARIALGKFEVLMRADCLAADLPLLAPYLAREVSAADIADMVR